MDSRDTTRIVTDLLEINAKKRPQKVAVIDSNKEITYSMLDMKSDCFAYSLIGLGISKGDRVVIVGENCIEFIIAMFGCLKIGAIFIPLHFSTPMGKLQYIIKNSSCKAIITSDLTNIPDNISKTTIISFLDVNIVNNDHTCLSFQK